MILTRINWHGRALATIVLHPLRHGGDNLGRVYLSSKCIRRNSSIFVYQEDLWSIYVTKYFRNELLFNYFPKCIPHCTSYPRSDVKISKVYSARIDFDEKLTLVNMRFVNGLCCSKYRWNKAPLTFPICSYHAFFVKYKAIVWFLAAGRNFCRRKCF